MVVYPPVVAGDTMGAYEVYTYQYTGGPLMEADLYSEGTAYPPMGATPFRTTTYTYDKEGQTLSETDLKGLIGTWSYDVRGRESQTGDGKGNLTAYSYTAAGSLYQELYPGYASTTPGSFDTMTYAYDPDQNVTQTQDGRGVVTSYQRNDPESLVTQTGYSSLPSTVTPINSVLYAYDGYGRETSMDDTAGTGQAGSRKVYTYDDLDELQTSATSFTGGPQSQTLTYAHNNDGSRKSMLTPTSASVANPLISTGYVYAHDGAHRLTGVTFPWHQSGSSGPSEQNTLSYFDNDWLNISANSRFRATTTYDARGFVTGLSNTSVTMGTSLASFSAFSYDAAGNRGAAGGVAGGFTATLPPLNTPDYDFSHVMTYTYDARDELTEEKSAATSGNTAPATASDVYDQTFAFDLAYNRTAFEDVPPSSPFSYMFGPDNQNSNTAAFTYDGSGDPTQYNGSSSTYAYDPEQRLTGLGGFSAHYDGDGLRDYTIASGTTTYFVYDGSSPVLEETYAGSTTTIQVANGMADGWRERYAATSFGFNAYGFDPQGNLSVEDSSFDTTLPAQNVYVFDGYGNRLVGERVSNGSTTAFNVDPVQFGGQYGYYTDTSTGEVDLTHRYYDTATGHFLNRDPIGYNGGQNLYAFCDNNPINEIDPDGDAGHRATMTVIRGGVPITRMSLKSGSLEKSATWEFEQILHAKGMNVYNGCTHTEARGLATGAFEPGDKILFHGELPPCAACKNKMSRTAKVLAVQIEYQWLKNGNTQTWLAEGGATAEQFERAAQKGYTANKALLKILKGAGAVTKKVLKVVLPEVPGLDVLDFIPKCMVDPRMLDREEEQRQCPGGA